MTASSVALNDPVCRFGRTTHRLATFQGPHKELIMSQISIPISSPRPAETTSARVATLAYGLLAYVAFWWVPITYTIGFVGNWVVPKSIDSGTPGALVPSMLINAGLLMVFALQHTIMARPGF